MSYCEVWMFLAYRDGSVDFLFYLVLKYSFLLAIVA